ncbi:MAG TPA: hypothetical protein VIN38_14145 [Thiobacillus sp.]
MTTYAFRTRISRRRARRSGALTLVFSALLSPLGKILLGTVVAATLIGGAVHQFRQSTDHPVASPTAAASGTSFHLARTPASGTVYTQIESDGKSVPIVLLDDWTTTHRSENVSAQGITHTPGSTPPGSGQPSHPHPWTDPGAPGPQSNPPAGGMLSPQPTLNTFPPGFSRPPNRTPTPVDPRPGSAPPQGHDPQGEAGGPSEPQGEAGKPSTPNDQSAPNTPETKSDPDAIGTLLSPPFSDAAPTLLGTPPPLQTHSSDRVAMTIPEPSILMLMLAGLAGLVWGGRPAPVSRA